MSTIFKDRVAVEDDDEFSSVPVVPESELPALLVKRSKILAYVNKSRQGVTIQQFQHALSRELCFLPCTEDANSIRFAARYGHVCKYVPEKNKWVVWNGRIWVEDNAQAGHYAKQTIAYLDIEADLIPPPKNKNGDPLICPVVGSKITSEEEAIIKKFVEHDKHVEQMHGWCKTSGSKKALNALLELAKDETDFEMTVHNEQFDDDDLLLNCRNGILDLRTGELLPHDAKYLMKKLAQVDYMPGATCPKWEKFINKVMLSREGLARYLQQLSGFEMGGRQFKEIFPVDHGGGENGKSMFIDVKRELLGAYARVATATMFMESKNENDRFTMADYDGVRFLIKEESKQGRLLDEGMVKACTSGMPLSAEFKFGAQFSYRPKFTVAFDTNHKPRITGSDHGIWRRVKLIPWEYNFQHDPERKDDREEVLAEFRSESSGILNWMLVGLQRYLKEGYFEPAEVRDATSTYKATNDIIGQFIEEKCFFERSAWIGKGPLFELYKTYMDEAGMHPMNKPNFGEELRNRGIEEGKTGARGHHWIGIRERKDTDPIAEKQAVPVPEPTPTPTPTPSATPPHFGWKPWDHDCYSWRRHSHQKRAWRPGNDGEASCVCIECERLAR